MCFIILWLYLTQMAVSKPHLQIGKSVFVKLKSRPSVPESWHFGDKRFSPNGEPRALLSASGRRTSVSLLIRATSHLCVLSQRTHREVGRAADSSGWAGTVFILGGWRGRFSSPSSYLSSFYTGILCMIDLGFLHPGVTTTTAVVIFVRFIEFFSSFLLWKKFPTICDLWNCWM